MIFPCYFLIYTILVVSIWVVEPFLKHCKLKKNCLKFCGQCYNLAVNFEITFLKVVRFGFLWGCVLEMLQHNFIFWKLWNEAVKKLMFSFEFEITFVYMAGLILIEYL